MKNQRAIKVAMGDDDGSDPINKTQASSKNMFAAKRHTVDYANGTHYGSGRINQFSEKFSSRKGIDEGGMSARKPVRLLNKSDMAKTLHTLTSPHRHIHFAERLTASKNILDK